MTQSADQSVDHVDITSGFETPPEVIDWSKLGVERLAVYDQHDLSDDDDGPVDLPEARDRMPIVDTTELLTGNEPLDPTRRRVPLDELHPERLTPASDVDHEALRRAHAVSQRPEDWIHHINPGFHDDIVNARVGRTENCADCARAVQSTLDNKPIAAASIDRHGLPLRYQKLPSGGETIDYTEQWAGRRAVRTSYAEIGTLLSDTRGSAIVFVVGDTAHATNAAFDAARGRVVWLDGQIGVVEDWPPPELITRFPDVHAIFFGSNPTVRAPS